MPGGRTRWRGEAQPWDECCGPQLPRIFWLRYTSGLMAEITSPKDYFREVNGVEAYVNAVSEWHKLHKIEERRFQSEVWFRGAGKVYEKPLEPGVYRADFTKRAKNYHMGSEEERRLQMERVMLDEFRTVGAAFFDANNIVNLYFIAQHNGMPTRLLDWTTNPLAGLFFAVEDMDEHNEDGEVFVMEAKKILPKPAEGAKGDEALWGPVSMRHPYVTDAIGDSFWHWPSKQRAPVIIPVKPDNHLGRIGQQSSCFTLHMHNSMPRQNPTLKKIKVPSVAKPTLLKELHRMNVNQFTIFNDLDHLSKDIRRTWEVK